MKDSKPDMRGCLDTIDEATKKMKTLFKLTHREKEDVRLTQDEWGWFFIILDEMLETIEKANSGAWSAFRNTLKTEAR